MNLTSEGARNVMGLYLRRIIGALVSEREEDSNAGSWLPERHSTQPWGNRPGCTIGTMSGADKQAESGRKPAAQPGADTGLFGQQGPQEREPRSPLPWVIAGALVVIVVGVLIAFSHRTAPSSQTGPGLAAIDPYASNLPITHLQMSQAGNRLGGQSTYIDGQIANKGDRTVTGITVQVVFHGFTAKVAQKVTTPMSLIRTREPYVDTESVQAAPIQPGQTRDFRLIFDNVSQDWNQNYPEIRIVRVVSK